MVLFNNNELHVWLSARVHLPNVQTYLLCDNRTNLVLNDDVGLNPETEGRRRIPVLTFCFCNSIYVFSAVSLTEVSEYVGCNS